MHIPFLDLRAQHNEVRAAIEPALSAIIDSSAFIGGAAVTNFEQHFADYCGARYAIACANGTDALKLALMACGVRRDHEVITVPNTFIATTEAITMLGAYPVFVDIDGPTYNLSPERLAEFLAQRCRIDEAGHVINLATGRRVTAIMPVHLYGLTADMQPILDLAARYRLCVIEDACQAHGAGYTLHGVERRAGTFGGAAAFSFYPGKNLGAMGDAGAVVTVDEQKDRAMRIWRDHGQIEKYIHVSAEGWNGRLDAMQCAILDIKLQKLDEWNARRRQVAAWYRERLAGDERIVLPIEPEGYRHVYHLFVVRVPQRDAIFQGLTENGVGVGLHYPIPLHLQAAYRDMGWHAGDFPETEAAAASILSLPMFPHLSEEQVDYVCSMLSQQLDRLALRERAVNQPDLVAGSR